MNSDYVELVNAATVPVRANYTTFIPCSSAIGLNFASSRLSVTWQCTSTAVAPTNPADGTTE